MMKIDNLIEQAKTLPSIPKIIQELIQSLGNEGIMTGELARQLSADQALSAKVQSFPIQV